MYALQGSWEKMLERVANAQKKDADVSPSSCPANRGCLKLVSTLSQYPSISQDGSFIDKTVLECHMNTLKAEMHRELP